MSLAHIISIIKNYLVYFVSRLLLKKPIRVYYWQEHPNFGDLLTPALLRKYGYIPLFFYPNRAQLISTGSLIEHINSDYKGVILGTGAIDSTTNKHFPNVRILGLRGRLTKDLLKVKHEVTLGDPGLLASKLLKEKSLKKFKIGIVPHYSDWGNRVIIELNEKYQDRITIIDVQHKLEIVLKAIDECEYILSSSLHGLICADSLGIPNRWILLSPLLGGNFKFNDYYSVFDVLLNPLILTGRETLEELIENTSLMNQDKIEIIKKNLEREFINLSTILYD